jgi:hypothetical protein
MEDGLVARATAAASSLAQAVDVEVNEAVVIQNSNTLALRLLPCDTFARTALVGQEAAAFEVRVAKTLAAVTAPIASLDPQGGTARVRARWFCRHILVLLPPGD